MPGRPGSEGVRLSAGRYRFLYFLLLGLCLAQLPWHTAAAFEAPAFQGDVLDEAGLLDADEVTRLTERIRTLRDASGIWAAVYVTRSLQGDSIEDAAVTTFERWRLGQAGKDNGLLVLVASTERRMRIEVGYGLEGSLTDAFCRRVIDDIYKPAFRDDRFADGLMQGFEVMAQAARGENPLPDDAPSHGVPDFDGGAFLARFLAAVAGNLAIPVFYLAARAYGRSRGRVVQSEDAGGPKTLFMLFGFFGVFFGIFYAVFGFAFAADPEVMPMLVGMNAVFAGLFALPFLGSARAYLSATAYRRRQARTRLIRMRRRSLAPRPIFGVWFDPDSVTVSQGGTKAEPRSSSSSSSSFGSSSSSSGGGRSGGGGASGSW